MGKLILLRHGQSVWNQRNLFTGWVDIPLSSKGIEESLEAGRKMASEEVDIIFVSTLERAITTATLAMSENKNDRIPCMHHPREGKLETWGKVYSKETEATCIPMVQAWELNERMYGELQGLNKKEMMQKFGDEQVKIWRRSYDVAPPGGESLAMTAERTLPYFKEKIVPHLKQGKTVLISAHGNSLRAIIMYLDNLSKEEVVALEVPTGVPIYYTFAEGTWKKG